MEVQLEVRSEEFQILYKQIFCLTENKGAISELKGLKKKNPKSYVPLYPLGSVQKVSSRIRDLETQLISFRDEEILDFNICFPVLDKSSTIYVQIKIENTNDTKIIKVEGECISIGKGIGLIEAGSIEECILSEVLLCEIIEFSKQYLERKYKMN